MTFALALTAFPAGIRSMLVDAYDSSVSGSPAAMLAREGMSPGVALMAGLALDPVGRPLLDDALDAYARPGANLPASAPEVIIGGGAHAAIYASVRRALGFPVPLVLDAGPRFGGEFAGAVRPAFYLNSRNRPGPSGPPGSTGALNVIPAAPMQPSDIGGSEYQTDADLGLVIRCALALNSTVRRARVEGLSPLGNGGYVVETSRGSVGARRVIVATGAGSERRVSGVIPDGQTVYSFRQWMTRVGTAPFPLSGLGRVAVIGIGDGARTVVESLTGIGPMASPTVAALDYVERVDWYGALDCASDRDSWLRANRTRYQRLGALFPVSGRDNARVRPLGRASYLAPGYLSAEVDGSRYETVIVAAGRAVETDLYSEVACSTQYRPNGVSLARTSGSLDLCRVGPVAGIPFESTEDSRIGENAVGLFRLAPRTATLASTLPAA